MNGLGLAGVELHGMIGYNVLARYRMEIDLTRDKMVWTELEGKPKMALSLAGKARGAGEIDLLGGILKSLGHLLGTKASPPVRLRGFLGVELKDDEDNPVVQSVLAEGPAGKAGVKAGDRITRVQGRSVLDSDDVQPLPWPSPPRGRPQADRAARQGKMGDHRQDRGGPVT